MSTDDLHTIRVDEFLPHPPEKIWRALTEPELIARWLMPAPGFRLEVGHEFTFQTDPIPGVGFGGIGYSQVLAFDEPKMLRIAWRAAPSDPSGLDSVVAFTLSPEGTGTRLFIEHDGFDPDDPYQLAGRRMMGGGWKSAGNRISAVL
jgi:uncharacterized protein YndB with AHSA1/START domain